MEYKFFMQTSPNYYRLVCVAQFHDKRSKDCVARPFASRRTQRPKVVLWHADKPKSLLART